jgi:hypothetical protein
MNQRHDQHKLLIFNAQVHQAILKIVEIHLPLVKGSVGLIPIKG